MRMDDVLLDARRPIGSIGRDALGSYIGPHESEVVMYRTRWTGCMRSSSRCYEESLNYKKLSD